MDFAEDQSFYVTGCLTHDPVAGYTTANAEIVFLSLVASQLQLDPDEAPAPERRRRLLIWIEGTHTSPPGLREGDRVLVQGAGPVRVRHADPDSDDPAPVYEFQALSIKRLAVAADIPRPGSATLRRRVFETLRASRKTTATGPS